MRGRFRILIASTGLLLLVASSARAQTISRETGSVTVGGYLLWVRGTNANVVELYVGRGFRDAFARSHDMDAARVQQWIDSVRAVSPVPAEDSSTGESQPRGSALSADVTMMRRVGGTFSGLRLLVNGEDPIRMAESTTRDFIAMLDSAARVTRELSQPKPLQVARTPAPPAPALQPPRASALQPPPAPALPPPPAPAPPPAPPPPAPVPPPPPPPPPAPAPAPPPPPPPPPAPAPAPPPPPPPPPAPAPRLAPPVTTAVAQIAPAVPVTAPARDTPARDTVAPPHAEMPSDKLIRTPLGPFTVPSALLSDRDKEAQYCYRQLGLKYNPDLKGEITVRLSLGTNGAVQDAVVTKRSWQGISAGEVESCVRALAHDWTFASSDPAVMNGAKIVTFSFAP